MSKPIEYKAFNSNLITLTNCLALRNKNTNQFWGTDGWTDNYDKVIRFDSKQKLYKAIDWYGKLVKLRYTREHYIKMNWTLPKTLESVNIQDYEVVVIKEN